MAPAYTRAALRATAWRTASWRPCAGCTWLIPSSAPSRCSPLREQQPDLAAGNKEVREALAALKAEKTKATEATAAPPAAAAAPPSAAETPATEESGAPPNVAISLACFGCARLPSEMGDGLEKYWVCTL